MPAPRLTDRHPQIAADELVAAMVPPPRFDHVRFDSYLPSPEEPSQTAALDACRSFAEQVSTRQPARGWLRSWLGGSRRAEQQPGMYLDGGFGVGKTHLLAST